jgi:gamma-glutamyl-gamma-aminobutyrate hydrolase PuuD
MNDNFYDGEKELNKEDNIKLISTKANTLNALEKLLGKSMIEEMLIIIARDYRRNKRETAEEVSKLFRGEKIVVRSSSTNEDCMKKSNAGHYTSVLEVDSSDTYAIINAIDTVLDSYLSDMNDISEQQVLIQHQAVNVAYSGVLFTYDIQGQRPYYLINYDDSGSTDSVTSGKGGKTLWIARNIELSELDTAWKNLIISVNEIEDLFKMPLDIEFAINKENQVIIFQVRPLVANFSKIQNADEKIVSFYNKINKLKDEYHSTKSSIDGKTMMFSDMAFWNPSEIIGTSPRTLDYSLYRYIITSKAWNQGLVPMGYRKLDDELMYKIGVKPYISLDYSCYSLIPSDLSEELAERLVSFYKKKLTQDTTAHDKIEFEIVYSNYDLNTEKRTLELLENGFTQEERNTILQSLKKLTYHVIQNHKNISLRDNADIKQLEKTRKRILDSDIESQNVNEIIGDIIELLEEITIYGTPQFTRQARMAFIARAFCSSFVESGWFSKTQIDEFMKSIATVSSKFEQDYQKFSSGQMTRNEFNQKYGHLRSGTYDIRTDSYNQMVFRPAVAHKKIQKLKEQSGGLEEKVLEKALKSIELEISPQEFNDFLTTAIEGREYFKFEFTKSLSLVIDLIQSIGKLLDIERNNLSWISVEDLSECINKDENSIRQFLNERIAANKSYYKEYSNIILPDVILNHTGISVIPVNEARPNFITSKKVEGEVVNLELETDEDLMDKIVMIPKADPGYEWIFTKGIKGFVTKYGGMASHMAIRCAEFEIPAAIGCGEKIYNYASRINYMELDCANGSIKEGLQCEDLRALITQREGVNQYGDPTDVLEAAYIRFYELLGFIPQPASNHVKNVGKLFERQCDLLIVVGGGALPIKYYDRPHEEELQPHRDAMEEKLIRHCIGEGIPIIATCRGMQYMNVLFGGRLLYHPELKENRPRGIDHEVYLCEEDRTIWVNNFHRDVIPLDGLAPCFKPLAIDRENQTIEAFGSEEMKILALQWHPERKFETSNALEETRKLVVNFIQKHIR